MSVGYGWQALTAGSMRSCIQLEPYQNRRWIALREPNVSYEIWDYGTRIYGRYCDAYPKFSGIKTHHLYFPVG